MKLSELNKKRLTNFKKNKRGYYSLIIFVFLLVLTLFAEVIANDKPVLLKYKGEFYFPIVVNYSETIFGGIFETEADYKDDYISKEIEDSGYAIWPPIRFSYDTINYERKHTHPAPPSKDNWLGTDDRGRDVLARIIYGFRISVLFGLILALASSIIGIIMGALQGYYAGVIDIVCQRFMEIWGSVPTLFVLIIIASVIEPNFWLLLGFVLLFSWMRLVDVVRAEVLKVRNYDYVMAAKSLGVSERKIIFRHILPNSLVATVTYLPFVVSGAVTTLTSLDFLGFGLPPGSPSLGEILSQAKQNLQAPWLGITGFVVISLLLSLLVFTGEAARDALAPNKVFRK